MDPTRIDHWTKLGATLRESRITHEWSQQELASRANVSRSWLARVESGHRGIELEPLLRLLKALGLTLQLESTPTDQAPPPARPSREQAWGLR